MISRRAFLRLAGGVLLSCVSLGCYAFGVEPLLLTRVRRYRINPPGFRNHLKLKIAVLADIHACKPWMSPERIREIVDTTNELKPDLIVLLGDFVAGHHWVTEWVDAADWAPALSGLRAPLGVYSILGNHDWWEDRSAQAAGHGPTIARKALEAVGIPVLENDVVRLQKDGKGVWLAGLADQLALLPGKKWGRSRFKGLHDLRGTLNKVSDDAPVILLAHEPDIFPQVTRERVALTLSGHTHGGQIRLFGYSPVVPSRYGNRYAYGHVVEEGRHLVVSGGLGMSILPIRFGVRPEIVLLELGESELD